MNQLTENSQIKIKYNTQIVAIVIGGLILSIITFPVMFTVYSKGIGEEVYKLIFNFPDIFNLITNVLSILMDVLLLLYFAKLHKAAKWNIIIPVYFAYYAVLNVVYMVINIINAFEYSYYTEYLHVFLFSIVTCVINVLANVLVVIGVLNGLNNKQFLLPYSVIRAISILWSIIQYFSNLQARINDGIYLYIITDFIGLICTVAFLVAILLFFLNNRIPAILPKSKKTEKLSPEQALILIKDKLELGIITEEEYQAQRAEIINNL